VAGNISAVPSFRGVSHVELTVRDATQSAQWYARVLGVKRLGDFPEFATPGVAARVEQVMHMPTGLTFGLIQHEHGEDGDFSELRVGLDHLALAVDSREELEAWTGHLDECGVPHSGISDMPYGSVVVFRDPDNIQLELMYFRRDVAIDLG
jgi:catechol 2,3-dioxygenase-like lactoylglutathione lyase family enzyme